MDFEKYLDKYSNVSRGELQKIRDCCHSDERMVKLKLKYLHENREKEKEEGRPSLEAGPLVHVLSMSIRSKKDENKPLSVYGKIWVEYKNGKRGGVGHFIYHREREDAEILKRGGMLTLNGPDFSCWPYHAYFPLSCSRVDVNLSDGDDNIVASNNFSLDEIAVEDEFERVKSLVISCEQGLLVVDYIAIPLGVYCRIELIFHNRKDSLKQESIDVNGKVVVRYANTYGTYSGEECVIFEKQSNEFERVEISKRKPMHLSRCWVALPAYSSLVVSCDLSEFGTGRKVVSDKLELLAQPGLLFGDSFVLDDLIIHVRVAWFSPKPLGRCCRSDHFQHQSPVNVSSLVIPTTQGREEEDIYRDTEDERSNSSSEIEEMDTEGEHESSSSLNIPWGELRPHKNTPWPSPAVEIFSVFIGREKLKAVKVYGSIEVLSICDIFKRSESDALLLSDNMKSMPILVGSRLYEDFDSLEMEINIEDVDGHLAIKGHVKWAASVLDSSTWFDKQLSSVIQGRNGFASVHYSIFSEAVAANVKASLKLKIPSPYPKNVYGSLNAQYSCFDYSSRFTQDRYRSVLFKRTQDDSILVHVDETVLPLCRPMVVVPIYSSLVIDVDLSIGTHSQKLLSCTTNIEISEGFRTIETNECILNIEVEWCEVK
ncbi:unnamed protein product [Cuscuta epithymum]|uniref:DUF6598 domain-containing protein n=1 Tax=Cuscuta epithymum TaxID=186058 RepID=A0AAV0CM97_9ASTE|nr:unnamed protein product [Cuscuta epithymum]